MFSLIFFAAETNAQFGKRLKDKAKEAAERKANQKADEAINKGADKIDSVITGKKRESRTDKSNKETSPSETTAGGSADSNSESADATANSSYKEVIIKTNIRCETGKKKLEDILRDTDGVSSVMIDIDTGKLYLSSENPAVPANTIDIIRQQGFEADGKKPTKPIANPCK